MEVRVPREVRKYEETILFGLSMRQFLCSAVAVAVAVIAYFGLREYLGNEGVSWVCILVALPIALIGFVTYHEMTLEQFGWAWIKSELLMPKILWFASDNYMYMSYKEVKRESKLEKSMKKKKTKTRKDEVMKNV